MYGRQEGLTRVPSRRYGRQVVRKALRATSDRVSSPGALEFLQNRGDSPGASYIVAPNSRKRTRALGRRPWIVSRRQLPQLQTRMALRSRHDTQRRRLPSSEQRRKPSAQTYSCRERYVSHPHLRPCLLVSGHRNIVSPDCVDAVLSEARGRAMNASNSNVVSHRSNWRRQSDWLCVRAHAR